MSLEKRKYFNYSSYFFSKKNTQTLIVYLLICVTIFSLNIFIVNLLDIKLPFNLLQSEFKENRFLITISAIFIGPVIEEIYFRLALRKTIFYLITVAALGIALLITWGDEILTEFIIIYITIIVIYQRTNFISNFFQICLITLSLISFVGVHTYNYKMEDLIHLSPFIILLLFLPQLTLGICTSAIRITLSFRYAILMHILYNSILIFTAMIFE